MKTHEFNPYPTRLIPLRWINEVQQEGHTPMDLVSKLGGFPGLNDSDQG